METCELYYPYHDEFLKLIGTLDTNSVKYDNPSKASPTDYLEGLLRIYEAAPEIPEWILNARFHRIVRQAKELAYQTTSNLTVNLSKRYFLTFLLEGDFLIVDNNDTSASLANLISACDSLRIVPNNNLFQLFLSYDLRLQED